MQYNASAYLKEGGDNVLAFWAAPGWSQLSWPQGNFSGQTMWPGSTVSAAPLVMAQLSVCSGAEEAGGGGGCEVVVATNASGWKASPSSLQHTGEWQWGNYGGEQIDWRQDVPLWSTTAPTSSWADAGVVSVDKVFITMMIMMRMI